MFLSQLNQAGGQIVIVWSHRVLGADGNHGLIALQTFAHAAHVHRDHLSYVFRNVCRAAVSHLFIGCEIQVNPAFRLGAGFIEVTCQPQQDSTAKLVVQEPALEKSAFGQHGPRVAGHEITVHDAQLFHIFRRLYQFVQHQFHRVEGPQGLAVLAVDMNGSVDQLNGAAVFPSVPGVDRAVFALHVVGIETAHIGQHQPPVCFDFPDHGTQRVEMGCQKDCFSVLCAASAQVRNHALFLRNHRVVAHVFQLFLHKIRRLCGVSRRAGDCQQTLHAV